MKWFYQNGFGMWSLNDEPCIVYAVGVAEGEKNASVMRVMTENGAHEIKADKAGLFPGLTYEADDARPN